MALVPKRGDRGIYTLKAPYQALVAAGIEYSCESIRSFAEIIEGGGEPFELYYQPRGLTYNKYEEDVLLQASIVTLRSSQGQWVDVPSTYIAGVPNPNGVPYHAVLLGISLGAIPVGLKLDSIKATISNVVRDYLGVNSKVEELVVSDTKAISMTDHDSLEVARLVNVKVSESDRSKAIRLETTVTAQAKKIKELEDYIKTKIPPG